MKINPSELINEIMEDNKPTKGQKAKSGLLVSYRIIATAGLFYLSYLATDWNKERENVKQKEAAIVNQAQEDRSKILIELNTISFFMKASDDRLHNIETEMKGKADKNDLRRLEDRFDNRLGNQLISYPMDTVKSSTFLIASPPNFKTTP